MKILIIHPCFSSQYEHIVSELSKDKQNQIVFLCCFDRNKQKYAKDNLKLLTYKINAQDFVEPHDSVFADLSKHVHEGRIVQETLNKFQAQEGFVPDVILAHPAWGSVLFIRDIYPHVPMISYIEYYEQAIGSNNFFDPLQKVDSGGMQLTRLYNSTYLHAAIDSDWLICPTYWQASRIPQDFQHKLSVLHDGINTDLVTPRENVKIKLSSGIEFSSDSEIVTYVARGFETMRGFPTVMAALPIILRERPKAHILMVGSDSEAYGNAPKIGKSWKSLMNNYIDYDESRVHWLGKLEYSTYIKILNLSSAHIYLTKPFILSWSLTESMAAGCNIVASATRTMLEVIKDGYNGLLVDFFSAENVAQAVCRILENKDEMSYLGKNARKTIEEKYALKKVLPLHIELIKQIAKGKKPEKLNAEMQKLNPKIEEFYNFPTYNKTHI